MDVKIIKYRSFEKNTLQGFCDVLLNGLRIKDCTHHLKNDQEWISFPARSYEMEGKTRWANLVEWQDKGDHWNFQEVAVTALKEYFAEEQNSTGTDVPF